MPKKRFFSEGKAPGDFKPPGTYVQKKVRQNGSNRGEGYSGPHR